MKDIMCQAKIAWEKVSHVVCLWNKGVECYYATLAHVF